MQCQSVVIGIDKLGDAILQWLCFCDMPDAEARDFRHAEDSLAIARRRLARLVEYCQGKREHNTSLGVPSMTLAQRMQFLAGLPAYKPSSKQDYEGVVILIDNLKRDLISLNESTVQ